MTKLNCYVLLLVLVWRDSVHLWPDHDISTLKILQVVHRHGDRSPIHFVPNDPFSNVSVYWPEGNGELSKQGKLRMYTIGKFIREAYQQFFGDQFSPREVYARSSLSSRCLESAAQILAGAYPPNSSRWQWANGSDSSLGLYWQPVPVESFMPKNNDTVLDVDKHCPKADEQLKRIFNSDEVLKALDDNKEFLSQLSESVGIDVNTLKLANQLFQDLKIEHSRALKWSDMKIWSEQFEEQVFIKLKPLAELLWNVEWDNRLIQRVRAGPLVDRLATNIADYIAGKPVNNSLGEPYRLFLYSTHDTKLAALMKALQIFDGQLIPFGATLLFELHQKPSLNYSVKIYYHNETDGQNRPNLMTLPGCDHQTECPFDTFKEIADGLVPEDWDKECGIEDLRSTMFVSNVVALVINILLLIILSSLIVYNCKNNKTYSYIPLEE